MVLTYICLTASKESVTEQARCKGLGMTSSNGAKRRAIKETLDACVQFAVLTDTPDKACLSQRKPPRCKSSCVNTQPMPLVILPKSLLDESTSSRHKHNFRKTTCILVLRLYKICRLYTMRAAGYHHEDTCVQPFSLSTTIVTYRHSGKLL